MSELTLAPLKTKGVENKAPKKLWRLRYVKRTAHSDQGILYCSQYWDEVQFK
jgi:hypothetical protein